MTEKRVSAPTKAALDRREQLRLGLATASSGAWATLPASRKTAASDQSAADSLLIRGGLLVTAEKRWQADLRIRHGRIAEIANRLEPDGDERVIEARDLQVLPGGIDPPGRDRIRGRADYGRSRHRPRRREAGKVGVGG